MTPDIFGAAYADAYTTLYRDKDYAAECDFLESTFRQSGVAPREILDLGCGTGGHAIILAQRGYKVTGIDRSPDMLRIARARAQDAEVTIDFHQGDIRSFTSESRFDAVISMFAVMSYLTENDDLAAACSTAYRHLRVGGIFVFDAWHGPGVLTDPPSERVRTIDHQTTQLIRSTTPVLNSQSHTVETNFILWRIENGTLVEQVHESHLMRFLFPQEIRYVLKVAGFSAVTLTPFMQPGRLLTLGDWQMAVVAARDSQ